MNMFRLMMVLGVSCMIGGCITRPEIVPQAETVQIIRDTNQALPATCRYLDEIAAFVNDDIEKNDPFGISKGVRQDYNRLIKNQTFALQGNTAKLVYRHPDARVYFDVYTVYRCT